MCCCAHPKGHQPHPWVASRLRCSCYLVVLVILPSGPSCFWLRVTCVRLAGDARFDPSADRQATLTFLTAMQLVRMISCSRRRTSKPFLQRSGMLRRCLHLLRYILAAYHSSLTVTA